MCVYPLRVNNTDKIVPASLQQDDKGRQFRLQMIILLEGTMSYSQNQHLFDLEGLISQTKCLNWRNEK